MLRSEKVKGFLADDIFEKLAGIDESYPVTANLNVVPMNRSVFVIKQYEKE